MGGDRDEAVLFYLLHRLHSVHAIHRVHPFTALTAGERNEHSPIHRSKGAVPLRSLHLPLSVNP